jgi:Leucine-rich repeat (LRR) protein
MKTLFKILSIGLFVSFVYSCNSDDPDVIINNLKEGQIEIKVSPDESNEVSFYVAATSITVDWGDGSIEEFTSNGEGKEFTHHYADGKLRTIKVDTESMTQFSIGSRRDSGSYKEIRLGDSPKLKDIYCYNNDLTILSIKKAPILFSLNCANNQLRMLDISGCIALESLYCENNQLKTLNVSKCVFLKGLSCNNNQLTSLDVSECIELKYLRCANNQLTSLIVSWCFALVELHCYNNQLSLLDVSISTKLTNLLCGNNNLTSLDVSKCTKLAELICSSNKLLLLDVTNCTELMHLYCSSNQLNTAALNSLFNSLPNNSLSKAISIGGNSGENTCDKTIATAKNWIFYNY